eukprot:Phypoly_transcript_18553.p1 GENE.Phypoly_transcript_18553~~Phypoly_transcript_18553.p1  ORF type:complete len:144 (+),score=18.43 Phypoly_transcript_18553:144-575(+)
MSAPAGEPTPAPQYEPYNAQNPTGYQPLYNQPQQYSQPYQPYPQPPYQGQYQPYQGQYQPAPQYGQPYQTAYVVTPNTTTYCVEETHCKSNGTGIGWILFIIGFFLPICWLIGKYYRFNLFFPYLQENSYIHASFKHHFLCAS